MKRCIIFSCVVFIALGAIHLTSQSVFAKTVFSGMMVLPGETPVKATFPDSETVIDIASIRLLPEGSIIAADTPSPFKILCADMTLLDVSPGEEFECRKPDVEFLAELLPPQPEVVALDPNKGPEDEMILAQGIQEEIRYIKQEFEKLDLQEQDQWYLLGRLYATQGQYLTAIALLESHVDALMNPALLRLLGELYLNTGNEGFRKAALYFYQALERSQQIEDIEGQAVAQHYLSLLLQAIGFQEEAQQRAQEALRLYQELGNEEQVQLVKRMIETP